MATNASGEFEKSLERLDQIVTKLEKDNPSLDESVALFREGRELAAKCEKLLKAAQASIEAATAGEPASNSSPPRAAGDGLPLSASARGSLRLDEAVAARAGVTRSRARSLIIAGRVRVDGRPSTKPGAAVPASASIAVERPKPYVSRGGEKLEGALADFALDVRGARALDVGASTGGFTDCLLAHGAASVVALDVGYGQLAVPLRDDPRVRTLERTNFRTLPPGTFGAEFDVVVIDASFISVLSLIARAREFLAPDGVLLPLVKPQFEAGRERLGGGGVVRDPDVHREILREARAGVLALGLVPAGVARSALRGPAGNVEFFFLVRRDGTPFDDAALERALTDSAAEREAAP